MDENIKSGIYFVRVNRAPDIRRVALETSKDMIVFLKRFHKLIQLRQARNQTNQQLYDLFSDMSKMAADLDIKIPSIDLGEGPSQPIKKAAAQPDDKEAKKPGTKQEKEPSKDDDLKVLEDSIAEIEKRLNSLI